MQNYLAPNQVFTTQEAAIRMYGEEIWEGICDKFRLGEMFTVNAVVGAIPAIQHLAPITQQQMIRAVLLNVQLERALAITDGSAEEMLIERPSKRHWKLV
jgi:hypothetical protein